MRHSRIVSARCGREGAWASLAHAEELFMIIQHVNDADHYRLTDEQVERVQHAMGQADRGEFASASDIREIFGRNL